MASFLELCQKVDKMLGTQGAFTTLTGVTGYQALLVDYVANAWVDIQSRRKNWDFMKREVDISLTAAKTAYTINDTHGVSDDPVAVWVIDEFQTTSDWAFLEYVDPITWNSHDLTTQRQPSKFTIHTNNTLGYLEFENPDASYTVRASYYRKPIELSADADEPAIGTEWHNLIAHQAAADMALYLGNIESFELHTSRAEKQFGDLLRTNCPAKTAKPLYTFV